METFYVKLKKHLNADNLIQIIRKCFEKVERISRKKSVKAYPFADALMSAFAIFSLKSPSLLAFEDQMVHEDNLKRIFKIDTVISDTHMRTILDEVDPKLFAPAFKKVFSTIQRAGELKKMQVLGEYYLVSIDGTGYFSSKKVHGDCCLEKKHRNKEITYHHQMLAAVLVHPDQKVVIPLLPEPIVKQDGEKKNDCERNACKRLIKQIKKDHPHLPLIAVEDGLASNAPHIRELKLHDFRFILGAKKGDHTFLFNYVEKKEQVGQVKTFKVTDEDGTLHSFRYINQVPLNATNQDLLINFVEYWETKANGKTLHFSWVTGFELSEENIFEIMRCGRTRWKIENETFNTLKNQDYHFEHNFGHGNKNLSVIFATAMMLAFLVDQVQQMCCKLFQHVWKMEKSKRALWEDLKSCFRFTDCDSMVSVFTKILKVYKIQVVFSLDTS